MWYIDQVASDETSNSIISVTKLCLKNNLQTITGECLYLKTILEIVKDNQNSALEEVINVKIKALNDSEEFIKMISEIAAKNENMNLKEIDSYIAGIQK
jgi:hypothetical protein